MRRRLQPVWDEVIDAVFPARCWLCGAGVERGATVCAIDRLPQRPAGPRCGRCARLLPPAITDGFTCAGCRRQPPRIGRLHALSDYDEPAARAWLLAFKHGGRVDLAQPLGAALADLVRVELDRSQPTVWVPVPLHPLRRLERGYDQARRLAEAVARAAGGSCRAALLRTRPTATQGTPGARSRATNVAGAFRLDTFYATEVRRADVWLVDDVATSGATLDECARVLKRAGAARVRAAVVARASRRGDRL